MANNITSETQKPDRDPVKVVPWWDPCPPEPPDTSALDEDALPGVPYAPNVFPMDCIQPGEAFPKPKLIDLLVEKYPKVKITAYYSPSHFWLQFKPNSELYNDAVETMINEITLYYEKDGGVVRRLCDAAMKVGQYCATFLHPFWQRAVIVRIIDMDHCKVRFVDLGLVKQVSIKDLKPLRRCWMNLPALAIRARQVGIRPPSRSQIWPFCACVHFNLQTNNRILLAQILAVDATEQVLEVYLSDTPTRSKIKRKLVFTEGIDHGAELIKSGFAEPHYKEDDDRYCSHYYPTFDVLESGATPAFEELEALTRVGIEPEDIPSFCKYVPPLEPVRCPTPPWAEYEYLECE